MASGGDSPTKRVEAETTTTTTTNSNTLLRPKFVSAFAIWNDFRETYEEENPYVPKLGGEMWKSFTEDEEDEEKEVDNKGDAPNGCRNGRGRGRLVRGGRGRRSAFG
ncbi:hypothetical protein F2Q69_00056504 [Brassica cretica]|uniref:HMG box domain-containing protein n=1 Tax=Brassica cretica TaxID=69181 RepID=A0A8S9MR95_BRACR|nr:hypothetical protein F2Q69_00056504 [Brassica cretica]